ncbi:MAG TPA: ABC transporter ATP-binding protein [Anaerolineales bacterium]|nr:ABC transporter ATP-binding protein [Anaerolineales bacterium]
MIQVDHLHRCFKAVRAVDDLSLHVGAGEIYGLVGPDGAGKTTTLRLLCGALRPDSGKIEISGYDIIRQTELARAQIGYLPQRFSLYDDLTVLENIRFFAEVRGLSGQDWLPRCMEILAFVGMEMFKDRRAGQLSGGMKQKLGLAAALVHRPKVLLLDEPTTGVDPVTRQDFWQLIIRLAAEEGVALLISTPYMDEAARCNRVGFMQHGRILTEDTPEALRKQLEGRILELQGEPLPLLRSIARREQDVEDAQMFGDRIHLRVKIGKTTPVIERLSAQIPSQGGKIIRLAPVSPQLEDLFIALLEPRQ